MLELSEPRPPLRQYGTDTKDILIVHQKVTAPSEISSAHSTIVGPMTIRYHFLPA